MKHAQRHSTQISSFFPKSNTKSCLNVCKLNNSIPEHFPYVCPVFDLPSPQVAVKVCGESYCCGPQKHRSLLEYQVTPETPQNLMLQRKELHTNFCNSCVTDH